MEKNPDNTGMTQPDIKTVKLLTKLCRIGLISIRGFSGGVYLLGGKC